MELQYLEIKVQFAVFFFAMLISWVGPYESMHSVPLLYFPCSTIFIYGWDVQVTIENWLLVKLLDFQIALQVPSPKFKVFAGTVSTGCS